MLQQEEGAMAQTQASTTSDEGDTVVAAGIVTNPLRRRGKPTIAGTRTTAEEVLDKLAAGWSVDDIVADWPHLMREQVLSAIAYAAQLVREFSSARWDTHVADECSRQIVDQLIDEAIAEDEDGETEEIAGDNFLS